MSNFNRRSFLKMLGVGAGAAVGTRIGGPAFVGDALAQQAAGRPALLLIHLNGGYNAIFGSARPFLNNGQFGGVNAGNTFQVPGGGPLVDASLGRLPQMARSQIATVGVNHRQSAHGAAQMAGVTKGGVAFPIQLAAAMGGDGSIKCASLGQGGMPQGLTGTTGGVSLQNINDVRSTIDALKGNANLADRGIAGRALEQSQVMSAGRFGASPKSLNDLKDGYDTVIGTLKKAPAPYNFDTIMPAYGVNGTAVGNNFAAKLGAAELMIRAGSNVVIAGDGGWDSHGDSQGNNVRNMMNTRIIPPLITFFNRLWVDNAEGVQRNVVVCIMGDFARSSPRSDHATGVAATVIGATIKPGTTGQTDGNVGFNPGLPGGEGLYQMLSAALKISGSPFGPNTAHASLIA